MKFRRIFRRKIRFRIDKSEFFYIFFIIIIIFLNFLCIFIYKLTKNSIKLTVTATFATATATFATAIATAVSGSGWVAVKKRLYILFLPHFGAFFYQNCLF
jgi:RsiW-degrading membrane proteinase PrsW (M82 family)